MAYESKRFHDDPGVKLVMCSNCVHFLGVVESLPRCKAFLNGIPRELMLKNNHTEMFQGDHGIRFEQKPPAVRLGVTREMNFDSSFPSIYDLITEETTQMKYKILEIMKKAPQIQVGVGELNDVITGEKIDGLSGHIYGDQKYQWRMDVTYYIDKYNMHLRSDFLKYIGVNCENKTNRTVIISEQLRIGDRTLLFCEEPVPVWNYPKIKIGETVYDTLVSGEVHNWFTIKSNDYHVGRKIELL